MGVGVGNINSVEEEIVPWFDSGILPLVSKMKTEAEIRRKFGTLLDDYITGDISSEECRDKRSILEWVLEE